MRTYIGSSIVQAEPATREEYERKHITSARSPEVGDGYDMILSSGARMWYPKKSFDEKYRLATDMPFGLALEAAKKGLRVYRPHWNSLVYITAQIPDSRSKMMIPYLYIAALNHLEVMTSPWTPSQDDMFAEDWMIMSSLSEVGASA